jgi:hypothetical protein
MRPLIAGRDRSTAATRADRQGKAGDRPIGVFGAVGHACDGGARAYSGSLFASHWLSSESTMSGISFWHWMIIAVLLMTVGNGLIAYQKNRSVAAWVILGLMFNPIAFVVLLFLPKRGAYGPIRVLSAQNFPHRFMAKRFQGRGPSLDRRRARVTL